MSLGYWASLLKSSWITVQGRCHAVVFLSLQGTVLHFPCHYKQLLALKVHRLLSVNTSYNNNNNESLNKDVGIIMQYMFDLSAQLINVH